MEYGVVIVALQTQLNKVPTSHGGLITPQLDIYVSVGCVEHHLSIGVRLNIVDIRHVGKTKV